jgi:hypothetical protein
MFLGLTGGRARGYGLVGACVDAGDEVDEVAGCENENGGRTGVLGRRRLRYRTSGGVAECLIGQPVEVESPGGHIPALVVVVPWLVCP